MERGALIVEREGVAGLANQGIELPVRQFERPEIAADAPRHFVDGQAVSGNGIPEAEEGDVIDRALVLVVLGGNEQIAQLSKHPFDLKSRFEFFRPVRPVGHGDLSIEFLFGLVIHQPLFADQSVHHADGEGAPAEPKGKDVVALLGAVFLLAIFGFRGGGFERQIVQMRAIVAAGKLVDIQHVPLQAEAEGAAQDRERFEGRGADAVIVECDLLRTCQIERFKDRQTLVRQTLPAELPVPSESRMIRLFAIRTLAQARSRETGICQRWQVSQGFGPSTMKWATIALFVCPPGKMMRAIRLMWNAAHARALR